MTDNNPLDLRSTAPAAAAPPVVSARAPVQMPGAGVLPLTAGQVMNLTPGEEEQIKKICPTWTKGDPVPTNLADAIAGIQAEANRGGMLPVDPSTPPIDVNKIDMVDIDQLPVAKQQELQAAMEEMLTRSSMTADANAANLVAGADPAVNAAIQQAAQLDIDAKMAETPQPAAFSPPVPPDPAIQYSNAPKVADVAAAAFEDQFRAPPVAAPQPQFQPAPQPAAGPGPIPPPAAGSQGKADAATIFGADAVAEHATSRTGAKNEPSCQHCGWQHDKPDTLVPTDADKYAFLASVLGNQRFHKRLELLGGKVVVTFRTLLSHEASDCLEQVAADTHAGAVRGEGEWWRQHMLYRLCCGIESIAIDGVGLKSLPALTQVQFDEARYKTALPSLVAYVFRELLPQENVRRFVGREFLRFQKLTEKLEARLDDADFWKGIEGQPS